MASVLQLPPFSVCMLFCGLFCSMRLFGQYNEYRIQKAVDFMIKSSSTDDDPCLLYLHRHIGVAWLHIIVLSLCLLLSFTGLGGQRALSTNWFQSEL